MVSRAGVGGAGGAGDALAGMAETTNAARPSNGRRARVMAKVIGEFLDFTTRIFEHVGML